MKSKIGDKRPIEPDISLSLYYKLPINLKELNHETMWSVSLIWFHYIYKAAQCYIYMYKVFLINSIEAVNKISIGLKKLSHDFYVGLLFLNNT